MSLTAPDVVYDLSPVGLGTFEGRVAMRAFFEEYWATFEDYELELEETLVLGADVTLARLRQHGRLPGTSGFVELRYAAVTIWTDGLGERITNYTDIDEACAAAERLAQERG